jgi:hypothetical protein
MELSPYHQHRFPSSAVGSPVTPAGALPSDNYGTFNSNGSPSDPHAPLLPATIGRKSRISVYNDLVPFASWYTGFVRLFKKKDPNVRPDPVRNDSTTAGRHVLIAGGGGNIPLEIIRCLSEYFGMLEERGTVPGTTLGGMIGLLGAFEDSLTSMERILTTPLPL